MFIQQRKRDREQRRRVKKDREERQRQRNVFCVINVKYKEISWRVRKEEEKERKKVTSRSTEDLVLKNNQLQEIFALKMCELIMYFIANFSVVAHKV